MYRKGPNHQIAQKQKADNTLGAVDSCNSWARISMGERHYIKSSKNWDNFWLNGTVTPPKDADGLANFVDPDQTAPLGAV